MSGQILYEDLNEIRYGFFNWKMSSQAQKVIFSRKFQQSVYPTLNFNNTVVTQSATQKHLGMLLDVKLDFQGHLKMFKARGLVVSDLR